MEMVKLALDQLRGAVMIVYPMGLPPHDPIKMEFEDQEDLSGTQVNSLTCSSLKSSWQLLADGHMKIVFSQQQYHKLLLFGILRGDSVFTVSLIICYCPLHPSIPLLVPSPSVSVPQASLQVITEDECQLWWAAKEMQRGKKLQDYIGKNEKTKLIVKIQKVRAISAHLKRVLRGI